MPRPVSPPPARFWAKIAEFGECWIWLGCRVVGYGQFYEGGGRRIHAHRWAYQQLIAAIPEELELDHLCRTPACVNPAHLEAVTPRVNKLRGLGVMAINAAKTECKHGHPLDQGNIYRVRAGRVCLTCKREIHKNWARRQRATKRRLQL